LQIHQSPLTGAPSYLQQWLIEVKGNTSTREGRHILNIKLSHDFGTINEPGLQLNRQVISIQLATYLVQNFFELDLERGVQLVQEMERFEQ